MNLSVRTHEPSVTLPLFLSPFLRGSSSLFVPSYYLSYNLSLSYSSSTTFSSCSRFSSFPLPLPPLSVSLSLLSARHPMIESSFGRYRRIGLRFIAKCRMNIARDLEYFSFLFVLRKPRHPMIRRSILYQRLRRGHAWRRKPIWDLARFLRSFSSKQKLYVHVYGAVSGLFKVLTQSRSSPPPLPPRQLRLMASAVSHQTSPRT